MRWASSESRITSCSRCRPCLVIAIAQITPATPTKASAIDHQLRESGNWGKDRLSYSLRRLTRRAVEFDRQPVSIPSSMPIIRRRVAVSTPWRRSNLSR